jgi:hypothetical protein
MQMTKLLLCLVLSTARRRVFGSSMVVSSAIVAGHCRRLLHYRLAGASQLLVPAIARTARRMTFCVFYRFGGNHACVILPSRTS